MGVCVGTGEGACTMQEHPPKLSQSEERVPYVPPHMFTRNMLLLYFGLKARDTRCLLLTGRKAIS